MGDLLISAAPSSPEMFTKKVFLETLLQKRLWQRCFPVNFAKFLRTPFLREHLRWLPLQLLYP